MSATKPAATVLLAAPRGFCAGVRRAIAAVSDALAVYGPPVYVRRPIVHNLAVVRQLEALGAVFVHELDEIPTGAVVVLSAHGVSPEVTREAGARGLRVYDAVCPLVAKVHREVEGHRRARRHVVLIGHAGHPEIEGTLGHLPAGSASLVRSPEDVAALPFAEGERLAYAVQTTFSVADAAAVIAALQDRFRDLAAPRASDICYATTNRQETVRAIAPRADAVIVVGEGFSSNARRLAEVASEHCSRVQQVADGGGLEWARLPPQGGTIGVTAAASTPDASVAAVLRALGTAYALSVREFGGERETVRFRKLAIAPAPVADRVNA